MNLVLLRQDVDRFARSAQQLEEAHERRRQEITRLEVELETKGALGLEEQRAERGRELEAATRRADELLDDALVNTDEDRLGQMKCVLYDAAQRHQVLILTCHPAAWRDLGVVHRTIQ